MKSNYVSTVTTLPAMPDYLTGEAQDTWEAIMLTEDDARLRKLEAFCRNAASNGGVNASVWHRLAELALDRIVSL